MSEITTGSVPVAIVLPAVAVGAACLGAAYFAAKYCVEQYERMLSEIEGADARLQWLDKQVISSPRRVAEEARRLQKLVARNNTFRQLTSHMNDAQRDILAGVIATERSPLRKYVPSLLNQLPEESSSFEAALTVGARSLAVENLAYVNGIVRRAAVAAGFSRRSFVLKRSDTVLDMVFEDRKKRRFTAYCKINWDLNPSLALDLEGFAGTADDCSLKMDEIIKYLHEHGVPFRYKRVRHNQPSGVLRKLLRKKSAEESGQALTEYLHGNRSCSAREVVARAKW